MTRVLYFIFKQSSHLKLYIDSRMTDSGRLFLIMAMVSCFFGLNTDRSMFFQFFPLLFLVLFIGFIFSLRLKTDLQCTRTLPETCIAGRAFTYSIAITNSSDKPIKGAFFKECLEHSIPQYQEFKQPLPEERATKRSLARLLKYKRWQTLRSITKRAQLPDMELPPIPSSFSIDHKVHFLPEKRGNMHFEGYKFFRKDPLGLFKKEITTKSQANILILPKLYHAPQLQFSGSRKYHQGGLTAAGDHGDSEEFISLREYMPGDPLKHIDWKSSAKTTGLIVKQYKNEYFSRYSLVLDTFCTEQNLALFEDAVSVAASILMVQDLGENVLDLLFVGDKCYTETTGSGLSEQLHMLKILASVQPKFDGDFSDLTNLIKGHAELLSGVMVILFSVDEARKELLNFITASRIPCKIALLCEEREQVEKELQQLGINTPLQLLEQDKIAEQLMSL